MAVNVPPKWHYHWTHPWTRKAKYSLGFRRYLQSIGRLSPHFTLDEAACKNGTPLPVAMRPVARNHAFNLERFRHEMGDIELDVLSWYRTPAYNRMIGGARYSRHMFGDATDFDRETVEHAGREKWFRVADRVFAKGGVGDYPSGSAHLDSRGSWARWRSF